MIHFHMPCTKDKRPLAGKLEGMVGPWQNVTLTTDGPNVRLIMHKLKKKKKKFGYSKAWIHGKFVDTVGPRY